MLRVAGRRGILGWMKERRWRWGVDCYSPVKVSDQMYGEQ